MPSHTATQDANPKAKKYMVGSILLDKELFNAEPKYCHKFIKFNPLRLGG